MALSDAERGLARALFPKPAALRARVLGGVTTATTVQARATGDSEGGSVLVDLGGQTVSGGGDQWVEVPCSTSVRAGDDVLVYLQGEVPVDAVVIGSGDKVVAEVAQAREAAESSITQTAQSIMSQVSDTISQTRQELSTAIASGDASVRSDLAAGDQAVRDDLDEAVTDLGQQIAAGDQQVTQTLSSSITQTAQSITSLITQGGDQTMMRVYSDGVLVGRVGAQICVLVNASGSVDIVRVSWSGSSPSSVTTVSRFDDDEVMLGAERSIVSLAGTLTISGSAGWDPDSGITGSHAIHASPPVMRWLSSAKKNGVVRSRRLGFSGLDANGFFEYKASDMSQVATGNADILIKALGALSNGPLPVASGGTGKASARAAFAALGGWTKLAEQEAPTQLSFDLSDYSEVLVAAICTDGTPDAYLGSAALPVGLVHASIARQLYLGGGYQGDGTNANGRSFACNLTRTKLVPVLATVDGSSRLASTYWYVYAR